MSLVLVGALAGLGLAEAGLEVLVRGLRHDFQWLVTEADDLPDFDRAALEKYFASSFDPALGWTRRPGQSGLESGRDGPAPWSIDATGSRARSRPELDEAVSVFGDSYAFCRQVADHETWENEVSRILGVGVGNYGVGNYGVDQALMRYELQAQARSVRATVLAFVPETICRIQSVWKHYLEFGNTFAFKPRFKLVPGNRLERVPCPVNGIEDVYALADRLESLQAQDRFYREKYRLLQYRRPYLVSFFRRPGRQARLLGLLILRRVARSLGRSGPGVEAAPFAEVMRANIAQAHAMYDDAEATALFRAVLARFAATARSRGQVPLAVVLPQLLDLKSPKAGVDRYRKFFTSCADAVPVLDATEAFFGRDLDELYVEDVYGGHLSAKGNVLVGRLVADRLGPNL
ncbi:hypothetical protein JCM15519_28050 [Fundidesulfovibrio butyratiphilus]